MDYGDQVIVEKCLRKMQSGKEFRKEYSELVHRYSRFVFAIVLGRINDYHSAEEIVQEVFLKAFRKLGTFNSRGSFSAWLGRIARNSCIDALRRHKNPGVSLDEISLDHQKVPRGLYRNQTEAETNEVRRKINSAILSLPEIFRDVAVMRFLENLSYRQIAQRLGVPESTVKNRLFRIRKILHEKLTPLVKQL
jgi:RNA polymerase sigma-70 factor, ECF subfamily